MNKSDVLVVGNCIVDDVMEVARFPCEDEEVRAVGAYQSMGGNACNSAVILSSLGLTVELMSCLGGDRTAHWLLENLKKNNVGTDLCEHHSDKSTPRSSIWLSQQNGARTIVHYRDLPELSPRQLQNIRKINTRWLHFEGRNIQLLKNYLEQGEQITGRIISLEIEKHRPNIESLVSHVDTLIVSSHYLGEKNLDARQCIDNFKSINDRLNIVCTLGSQGVIAADSNGKIIEIGADPVPTHKIVDTIGAGDCFIAGLIFSMLVQSDFEIALHFANQLAAKKIQYRGMKFDD